MIGSIHTEESEEAAILAVQSDLDRRETAFAESRDASGYPGLDQIREAFSAIQPTPKQWAMLKAHLAADNHTLTATELAAAAGSNSYRTANSQYGKLAFSLAQEMEWAPTPGSNEPAWTFALARAADDNVSATFDAADEQNWRWKLRDELVTILEERVGKSARI